MNNLFAGLFVFVFLSLIMISFESMPPLGRLILRLFKRYVIRWCKLCVKSGEQIGQWFDKVQP